MSRGAHHDERCLSLPAVKALNGGQPCARRTQRGFPRPRTDSRIRVEHATTGGAEPFDAVDICRVMDQVQLGALRDARLDLNDIQTRRMHARDRSGDPLRTLGVSPSRVVIESRRMSQQPDSHQPIIAPHSAPIFVVSLCRPRLQDVMALPETPLRVSERGTWPGLISFRRGWAIASARPWNDIETDASLRLVRGGKSFLTACSQRIIDRGATSVLSPPLPVTSIRTWQTAGYDEFLQLALMRLSLEEQPRSPDHLVVETDSGHLDDLLAIDAAAFSSFWRFDMLGLKEALEATGRSSVLIIRDSSGKPTGFAIVGFGTAISYLQRVAVHPDWQREGMGRSLVRVAARKARDAGGRVMLLNTQIDNEPAMRLYESEGYVRLPEPLCLLRYTG